MVAVVCWIFYVVCRYHEMEAETHSSFSTSFGWSGFFSVAMVLAANRII